MILQKEKGGKSYPTILSIFQKVRVPARVTKTLTKIPHKIRSIFYELTTAGLGLEPSRSLSQSCCGHWTLFEPLFLEHMASRYGSFKNGKPVLDAFRSDHSPHSLFVFDNKNFSRLCWHMRIFPMSEASY